MSFLANRHMLMWSSFRLHTSRMSLADDVDLEEFVTAKDDLSGADIKAVCTEAGLLALRERRMRVTKQDFSTARERVRLFLYLVLPSANLANTGAVPEERGCAGGSVSLVKVYVTALIMFSYTSVRLCSRLSVHHSEIPRVRRLGLLC
jgi:hypothetical protein